MTLTEKMDALEIKKLSPALKKRIYRDNEKTLNDFKKTMTNDQIILKMAALYNISKENLPYLKANAVAPGVIEYIRYLIKKNIEELQNNP